MAGQVILDDLNSGKLENASQMTLEYLGPVINKIEIAEEENDRRYGLFATKFLRASVVHITAGRQPSSLLEAVLVCCQCYRQTKYAVKLTEPLTVLKILYHIVTKLQFKDHLENVLLIGHHLYEDLSATDGKIDGTTLTILNGAYSYLWNICIKLEDDKNFLQYDHTLRLRHLALMILLLREDSLAQVTDKYLIAVNRFDSLVQQTSKVIGTMDKELMYLPVSLTNELLNYIVTKVLSSEMEDSASLLLPIFFCLLKFIHKNDSLQLDQDGTILTILDQISTGSFSISIREMYKVYQQIFKTVLMKTQGCEFSKQLLKDLKLLNTFCSGYLENSAKKLRTNFLNLYIFEMKQLEKILDETGSDVIAGSDVIEILDGTAGVRKTTYLLTEMQKENNFELLLDFLNLEINIIYRSLKKLQVSDNTVQSRLIEFALNAQQMYSFILDSNKTGLTTKSLELKRYNCGYLMSNFGALCDDLHLYEEAINFYHTSFDQMSKWTTTDDPETKQRRIQEVKLQRLLDCYIEVHIEAGKLDIAMEIIVKTISNDLAQVPTAAKLWTRVRKEALRRGNSTFPTRSLAESLSQAMSSLENFSQVQLLREELNIFKNSSHRYYDVEYGLLCELLEKSGSCLPVEKARHYLDMVHLLWLSGIEADRSMAEYLQLAEQCLNGCTGVLSRVLQGEFNLWQYILQQGDWCFQSLTATLKMKEMTLQDSAPKGEESEIQSSNSSENMFTFAMETQAIRKLDTALALWEEILQEEIDNSIDVKSLMKLLLSVASICKLTGMQTLELRAVQVAAELFSADANVSKLSIYGRIVDVLITTGKYTEAANIMSDIENTTDLKQNKKHKEENILNALRWSEIQLHTGQNRKALNTLQGVFEFISSQKTNSKFVCTIQGRAKRLLSVLLSMPRDYMTETGSLDYSLDLAQEANRMHTGVFHFVLGKDALKNIEMKGQDFEMWEVLYQVLTTTHHCGQLYRLIGELRDAKCYLREGLKIAHHFGLPNWTGKFLLEMTRINVMAENLEEAVRAISDCHRLLGSEVKDQMSKEGHTPEVNHGKQANDKDKIADEFAFGFESMQLDNKCDTKTRNDNETNLYEGKLIVPPCLDHVTNNKSCDHCCGIYSKLFAVQLSFVIAQFLCTESSDFKAEEILKKLQNFSSKFLSSKGDDAHQLCDIKKQSGDFNLCNIPSKLSITSFSDLKSTHIETLVQRGELFLQRGEREKLSEIIKIATEYMESGQLVDVFHRCFFVARLELLKVLSMYPVEWSQITDIEDDVSLKAGIESLKICDVKAEIEETVDCLSKSLTSLKLESNKNVILVDQTDDNKASKRKRKDSESRGLNCNQNGYKDKTSEKRSGSNLSQVKIKQTELGKTDSVVEFTETKTKRSSSLKQQNAEKSKSSKIIVDKNANEKNKNGRKFTKCKLVTEKDVDDDIDKENSGVTELKSQKLVKPKKKTKVVKTMKEEKFENEEDDKINSEIDNVRDMLKEYPEDVTATAVVQFDQVSVKEIEVDVCTPPKQKTILPFKTPKSVCSSRKAQLDMLIDSSDEEETTKKSSRGRGRGRGRGRRGSSKDNAAPKKALYENYCEFNSEILEEEVSSKVKGKSSRIPRLISETKLTLNDNFTEENSKNVKTKGNESNKNEILAETKKSSRGKTQKKTQENALKINSDNESESSEVVCEVKEMKVSSKKLTGRSKTGVPKMRKEMSKNLTSEKMKMDSPCTNVAKNIKQNNVKTDNVYDFDEVDTPDKNQSKISKAISKGPVTTSAIKGGRNKRLAKVNNCEKIERARATNESVEISLSESDIHNMSFEILESLSESSYKELGNEICSDDIDSDINLAEMNGYHDCSLPTASEHGLEQKQVLVEPEADIVMEGSIELDDSIELIRGDNKKSKQTNQTQAKKKTTNSSGQNDTTEVLRSSRPTKLNYLESNLAKSYVRTSSKVSVEVESDSSTDATTISILERAYDQIKHFPPCNTYTTICQMLALQYLESSPSKAAFFLTESVAVTFRHQAMTNIGTKISKSRRHNDGQSKQNMDDGSKSPIAVRDEKNEERLTQAKSCLTFNKTVEDLKIMIDAIPEGWIVCQVSMVTNHQSIPQLLLTRLERDKEPITVRLPGFAHSEGRKILHEFDCIKEDSGKSFKVTDRAVWWKLRAKLDDRMHCLLLSIENYWLQHWKILMLGNPCLSKSVQDKVKSNGTWLFEQLDKLSKKIVTPDITQVIVQSCSNLTDQELTAALCEITGQPKDSPDIDHLIQNLRTRMESLSIKSDEERNHCLLILDKNIQHLPWESIPVLRNNTVTRVTRIPSLYHMYTQLSNLQTQENSVFQKGVDKKKVFYIVNPQGDFASTQETFQPWFESEEGWKGMMGQEPTSHQISQALTERDLFVYCGHGSGSRFLPGFDLQQITCRSVAILMGCSSGFLQKKGQLDAAGTMLNYFLADCPCIVANLWDVTDKDIDRFLETLLKKWLKSDKDRPLMDVIPEARDSCKLRYLIGAAPVVYGFPVSVKK